MLQPTFRRFLRELDEAPGGNNLQYIYILQYSCIPVSLFFGNQGLYNEIVLGDNGECSGVMCEGSSYSSGRQRKILEQSITLVNDLGFNLCVVPWSPVMRLVTYFGVKGSHQNRGSKKVE